MILRALELPDDALGTRHAERGVYSRIIRTDAVRARLKAIYGRDDLCLKLFKTPLDGAAIADYKWGAHSLVECTIIQNLFWRHGKAPRVYDIVLVNDYPCQVTEFIEGEPERPVKKPLDEVKGRYGLRATWDMNPKNFRSGKMLDFGFWSFGNTDRYRERLVKLLYERTAWGSRSDPYHSVPELGVAGQRDNEQRFEMLDYDFTGKTVLDIGCNAGMDAVLASRAEAKRVLATDLPHVADVAWEVANWLGAWNVDFVGLKLPQQATEIGGPFDVVLSLSVQRQIGYSKWLVDLCDGVLFFEGHVPDKERTYRETLERDFKTVEFLGMTRDHGPRPLFRCEK